MNTARPPELEQNRTTWSGGSGALLLSRLTCGPRSVISDARSRSSAEMTEDGSLVFGAPSGFTSSTGARRLDFGRFCRAGERFDASVSTLLGKNAQLSLSCASADGLTLMYA